MNLLKLTITFICSLSFCLLSCKPKIDSPENIDLSDGVFIVNEGNFMANNGEISFYNPKSGEIINRLFALQNNDAVLGDVIQSFCFIDSFGLIVVNNSKKIEIVNINNFKHICTISGLSYPRYSIPVRKNICYLSNGKNPGQILVINTENQIISDTIIVGIEPENLLLAQNKVFVANGAWGHDSTISIIDANTDQLLQTIVVGDGPTDLVLDKLDRVWVLCQGKTELDYPVDTPSKLVCFNSSDYQIRYEIIIGNINDLYYPVRIAINPEKDIVYYIEKEGVFRMDINQPDSLELVILGSFYGLEVDPDNGDIYVLSDNGFNGSGYLSVYNSNGTIIKQNIKTGIGPNGAVFK